MLLPEVDVEMTELRYLEFSLYSPCFSMYLSFTVSMPFLQYDSNIIK